MKTLRDSMQSSEKGLFRAHAHSRIMCGLFMPVLVLTLLLASGWASAMQGHDGNGSSFGKGKLDLSGRVLDTHAAPVADAEIEVRINGQPYGHGVRTQADGSFLAVLAVPERDLNNPDIELTIFKPSFKKVTIHVPKSQLAVNDSEYQATVKVEMKRELGPAFWIATAIFILAYALISFELLHRTLAAMLGASIMLVVSYTLGTINPEFHILSYERAIGAIDMNVVFLLMGMMIIVGILKHTGVFQWCAYKSYQLARGNVILLAVILMTLTAITSAFLDNVTTMLLLTPVTIEIAVSLGISPLALLLPLVLASNIGGTATLIGDPPNIMIGSYAGLTFIQFVKNLAPPVIVSMLVLYAHAKLVYGKIYHGAKIEDVQGFINKLRDEYRITDSMLLTVGLIILGVTIGFFLSHGYWHMEVSIAALFGAALLFTYGLATKRINLLELVEKDIEWTTLLFFMFLFILVGAVQEVGLLSLIADWVLRMSGGGLTAAICLILWVSAIVSAFVDNIPFTATMLPIVAYLTTAIPGAQSGVLWWALSLGACFGGNGTLIGASANVVTMGIAESVGYPVRFSSFMKVAFPYMIASVAVANAWLLLWY
jgi:Na+/H+ antiporter NhaD/arsenite permease-like protein